MRDNRTEVPFIYFWINWQWSYKEMWCNILFWFISTLLIFLFYFSFFFYYYFFFIESFQLCESCAGFFALFLLFFGRQRLPTSTWVTHPFRLQANDPPVLSNVNQFWASGLLLFFSHSTFQFCLILTQILRFRGSI